MMSTGDRGCTIYRFLFRHSSGISTMEIPDCASAATFWCLITFGLCICTGHANFSSRRSISRRLIDRRGHSCICVPSRNIDANWVDGFENMSRCFDGMAARHRGVVVFLVRQPKQSAKTRLGNVFPRHGFLRFIATHQVPLSIHLIYASLSLQISL